MKSSTSTFLMCVALATFLGSIAAFMACVYQIWHAAPYPALAMAVLTLVLFWASRKVGDAIL